MAIHATPRSTTHLSFLLSLLSLVALLNSCTTTTTSDDSDLVAELLTLRSQSQSPSGVIRLTDHLVARLLTSTKPPRPFSLLIFFDALQLHDNPDLHLKPLRSEFALLASSFISNNARNSSSSSNLFFCDLEFSDSPSSFAQFAVDDLPHIRLVTSTARNLSDDTHKIDTGDSSAESMAEFIESKTKLTVGPIHRSPFASNKHLTVIVAALLIWLPFMAKKVIAGNTLLHDPKVWLLGAVFVYFFSVSGTMHNLIRKVPMFLADRNDPSKLIFFYPGSEIQLGAEGFAIGFLYTIVGLLLAFMTHVLVKVRNVIVQRVVMIMSLFVSFWAVREVVYLDNWKTGYGIHLYWPSRWQ